MKFLVDRCAGRKLAEWLSARGHDVTYAPSLGPDPGDRVLLEWAVRNRCVLITIDTDFGTLVHTEHMVHHGIVRLPDVPAERRIRLMEQVLANHATDIGERVIITVRGGRIRVSKPPDDQPATQEQGNGPCG